MKPHPTKSKPRKPKPSPRQPGKGARIEVRSLKVGETSDHRIDGPDFETVLVLSLSPEARERRVEAIAKTLYSPNQADSKESGYYCLGIMNDCIELASFVLASLGDTPAREGRGE